MDKYSDEQMRGSSAPMAEGAVYNALSRIALSDRSFEEALVDVAVLAKQALRETPEASVTLLGADQPRTAAFSAGVALRLDERQYLDGQGPCLAAAGSGGIIEVTMDDAESPYPAFRQAATQEGVTHSLSVGIAAAGREIGALNLYSLGGPFTADSTRIASTFAGLAGLTLAAAGSGDDRALVAGLLQQALVSRAVINQAQGVLMGQLHCTRAEAFTMLIRLSEEQAVDLQEAARIVLNRPG